MLWNHSLQAIKCGPILSLCCRDQTGCRLSILTSDTRLQILIGSQARRACLSKDLVRLTVGSDPQVSRHGRHPMGPGATGFELGSHANQDVLSTICCDQLDSHRDSIRRPVQW
jgi:hypothetical protein